MKTSMIANSKFHQPQAAISKNKTNNGGPSTDIVTYDLKDLG